MLEMRDIEHVYGGRHVLGVERFGVQPGECLVLLGPNGSGKSTLLRLMSLVEVPSRGTVLYKGTEVNRGNSLEIRRRFALLLQRPVFFRGTVGSNVAYGLRVRGIPAPEAEKRLEEVASLFSLDGLLARRVDQLLGGEAQRVNLARAFIIQPEVLFLDEPFSALDAPAREDLLAELRRVIRETGQTTVFVTHHREEAAFLATRVAVLLDGALRQQGPVEEVFSKPVSDEVARLVGVETVLKGRVTGNDGELASVAVAGESFFVAGDAAPGEEVPSASCRRTFFVATHKPEGSVRNWFSVLVEEARPVRPNGEPGHRLRLSPPSALTCSAYRRAGPGGRQGSLGGVKATSIHSHPEGERRGMRARLPAPGPMAITLLQPSFQRRSRTRAPDRPI